MICWVAPGTHWPQLVIAGENALEHLPKLAAVIQVMVWDYRIGLWITRPEFTHADVMEVCKRPDPFS